MGMCSRSMLRLIYLLLCFSAARCVNETYHTASTGVPTVLGEPDESADPDKENYYMDTSLDKLILKYGDGVNMTFEGLEHLLQNLGLGQITIQDHKTECHKRKNKSEFAALHPNHNHSESWLSEACKDGDDEPHAHATDGHRAELQHGLSKREVHYHRQSENKDERVTQRLDNVDTKLSKRPVDKKCLSMSDLFRIMHSEMPSSITREMLKGIFPVLIIQLDADTCHQYHTAGSQPHVNAHFIHSHGSFGGNISSTTQTSKSIWNIPAKVWGFSSIAVLVISLVGLLGVAVIPIMQKVLYNHMLQFLVALAVGALSGDALLHLLPHAISGGHSSSERDEHDSADTDMLDDSHDVGPVLKGLLGLSGIFFFFLIERVIVIITSARSRKKEEYFRINLRRTTVLLQITGKHTTSAKSKRNRKFIETGVGEKMGSASTKEHKDTVVFVPADEDYSHNENDTTNGDEGSTMISKGHGHGHGHSHHADGVPTTISAIAWMVILGDGIHNFSDGLAIGAAFANNITGGFSTSVAVFCHELPHEIGDFAMLLRSGMSAKQAIIYNCLSSVLCFIGMLIGVAIGNIENASLWIFAIVGGMFLYIALVDMLPELTAAESTKGDNQLIHLLLQCAGILTGAGIMLIIGLYEERLKEILG